MDKDGNDFRQPGEEPTLVVGSASSGELAPEELRRRLDLPEGDRISDYGELRTLGIGGMGTVFSGRDPGLKCPVALKVLRPAYRNVPERVSAFIREARVTAQIGHPNIVPVHRIGVFDESGIYYSMKQVRGRTLRSILESLDDDEEMRCKFTPRRLLEIFVSACNAVAFAHHRGVLHCDLKPANLMVGDFGEVLVMDWGMAQCRKGADDAAEALDLGEAASGDHPELRGGTPAFMAPELLTGAQSTPDEQSDVYGLGAILYCILTRRTSPFPPDLSTAEIARIAASGRLASPRRAAGAGSAVPRELEAVAQKAMCRDRAKRYGSVAELLEDMHRYLDGYPVLAYSPNPLYRFFKRMYRRPLIPAVSIAALLTWVGFTAVQELRDRTEAESLLDMAAYNRYDGQGAEQQMRRDCRMAVMPHLAETAAGEALREDLERQKLRMSGSYTAALELLDRIPAKFRRRNARVGSLACDIFRRMLETQLMSPDKRQAADTLRSFRNRWPEQFASALEADPRLRRIAEMIDADVGVLAVEIECEHWQLTVHGAADPEFRPRSYALTPGQNCRLELAAGDYVLEFSHAGEPPIVLPAHVAAALGTNICFEPPERRVAGYAFVPSRTEMDSFGNLYVGGGFQLAKREVSNGEFRRFLATLPEAERRRILSGDDEVPVTGITGELAEKYCEFLSKELKCKVRLPREWEWRHAARGFDGRRYPWGKEYKHDNALLADSSRAGEFPNGAPAGSFPADVSPFGIFDMAGNVREYARTSASAANPPFVVLGGSYAAPPQCAEIGSGQFPVRGNGGDDVGFRCLIEGK